MERRPGTELVTGWRTRRGDLGQPPDRMLCHREVSAEKLGTNGVAGAKGGQCSSGSEWRILARSVRGSEHRRTERESHPVNPAA